VDTGANSSASSLADEFTRIEIGHVVMGSAGYDTTKSRGRDVDRPAIVHQMRTNESSRAETAMKATTPNAIPRHQRG
jgi:hypothetical protein